MAPQHLLVALLEQEGGIVVPVLQRAGADPDGVRRRANEALDKLPKQGSKIPWKLHQNYALDLVMLQRGKVDDGVMEFSNPGHRIGRRDEAAGLAAAG